MKIHLFQLHQFQTSKPLVQLDDTDEYIQWDYCDLEGLPPLRERGSMTDHGNVPKGQYNDLPETFIDTNGKEHKIENIEAMWSSE